MSMETAVMSAQGQSSEFHTGRAYTPNNADRSLANEHERWIDPGKRTDAMVFNDLFEDAVEKFNAKQSRPCRKIGADSSDPKRQKSYYDGIKDGTFCFGSGDQQEQPIEEIVIQFGNKDNNGVTDGTFDIQKWYDLKGAGHYDKASAYVHEHLSPKEDTERTKRILKKSVKRIAEISPEHIVVIRADYHGDEPCGTPHVHLGVIFKADGYKTGMESRVACVKALEQAGFKKEKDTEFGIVQLHERIKDIIAEEMEKDALEYGYEPIKRAPDSGEHRKRSDVDVFREMAAERHELAVRDAALSQMEEDLKRDRKYLEDLEVKLNERQRRLDENHQAQIAAANKIAAAGKTANEKARIVNRLIETAEKLQSENRQKEKEFQEREAVLTAHSDALEERKKELLLLEEVTIERERALAKREAVLQELILLGRQAKAAQLIADEEDEVIRSHEGTPFSGIGF